MYKYFLMCWKNVFNAIVLKKIRSIKICRIQVQYICPDPYMPAGYLATLKTGYRISGLKRYRINGNRKVWLSGRIYGAWLSMLNSKTHKKRMDQSYSMTKYSTRNITHSISAFRAISRKIDNLWDSVNKKIENAYKKGKRT